jgi:hypothetical protein
MSRRLFCPTVSENGCKKSFHNRDILKKKIVHCHSFSGFSKVSTKSNGYLQAFKMMQFLEQCITCSFWPIFYHRFIAITCEKILELTHVINNNEITAPIYQQKIINTFSILFAKILIFMDNFCYPYSYSEDTHSFHFAMKKNDNIPIHPIFWNMVLQSKINIINQCG